MFIVLLSIANDEGLSQIFIAVLVKSIKIVDIFLRTSFTCEWQYIKLFLIECIQQNILHGQPTQQQD